MKKGMRATALVLVCILLLSMGSSAMAAEYSRYSQAKAAVSNDSTIIMRVNPDSSTQADNVVKTLSQVEGKTFELLGENGDWYFARYEGSEGFVRKKDFDLPSASTSATSTSTATPQYSATDSAIWMRASASKDAEVTKKLSSVKGKTFTLLGESGDWYYAQYEGAEGFVRKQDFDLQTASTSTTAQYSKFSAAKSQVRQVEALNVKAQHDILTLIDKLYNEMTTYNEQLPSIDAAYNFAAEYLRIKEEAFKEGAAPSSDVVDAQLNLAKIKTERLQAAYYYDLMLARLLEACGESEMLTEYARRPAAMPIRYE